MLMNMFRYEVSNVYVELKKIRPASGIWNT